MTDPQQHSTDQPVDSSVPPAAADDGTPKFGRLLIVLILVVVLVGVVTYVSETMYS